MPPSPALFRPRPDPAVLRRLRARIQAIEQGVREGADGACGRGVLPVGVATIDEALPEGGLARAALHEITYGDSCGNSGGESAGNGSAIGFAATLLGRLAAPGRPVLWCRRRRRAGLYGPGLAAFGLGGGRLIVAHGDTDTDVLWAMEEGLVSGAPAAVLGEVEKVPPVALRRLQLAAEKGGVTGFLLHQERDVKSTAVTRWHASALPGSGHEENHGWHLRWSLDLRRCRHGTPGRWHVTWNQGYLGDGAADNFAVAADIRHRPAEATVAADAY